MKNSTSACLMEEFFKKNEIIGCFKVFQAGKRKVWQILDDSPSSCTHKYL